MLVILPFLLYFLAKLIAASDAFIMSSGVHVTEFKGHISMCCSVCSLSYSHSIDPVLYPHLCAIKQYPHVICYGRYVIPAVIVPLVLF